MHFLGQKITPKARGRSVGLGTAWSRCTPVLILSSLLACAPATGHRDALSPHVHGGAASSIASALDLNNRPLDPFAAASGKGLVLIFIRTDCPISNHYAPEIQRLFAKYSGQSIAFWLVYPNADASAGQVAAHLKEYELAVPAVRDTRHLLVKKNRRQRHS